MSIFRTTFLICRKKSGNWLSNSRARMPAGPPNFGSQRGLHRLDTGHSPGDESANSANRLLLTGVLLGTGVAVALAAGTGSVAVGIGAGAGRVVLGVALALAASAGRYHRCQRSGSLRLRRAGMPPGGPGIRENRRLHPGHAPANFRFQMARRENPARRGTISVAILPRFPMQRSE